MKTTFDFGDGKVPVHRHVNKNRDIGGWVADSATVESTVYIGENARVSDNARVSGNAWVYGNARVYGNAWVYGNARVENTRDYMVLQVFGSRDSSLIVTFKPELRVTTGCYQYQTLDAFQYAVLKTHGHSDYGKEYIAAIEFIKTIASTR